MFSGVKISAAHSIVSSTNLTVPGSRIWAYQPSSRRRQSASISSRNEPAPLGARVAHALDTGRLKRIFALLLFVLAGYMLYRGLGA